VELADRVAADLDLFIVPPGATLYATVAIRNRRDWVDETGEIVMLHGLHRCFAEGATAEGIL
jgi:hypothetical protein